METGISLLDILGYAIMWCYNDFMALCLLYSLEELYYIGLIYNRS